MPTAFHLSVVAPDRTVVDQDVHSVVAPGVEGYLGVQAGHAPIIVALRVGLLEYRDTNSQQHFVAINGGFMEVDSKHVIVLADSAELANEVDIRTAEETLEHARKALRGEDSTMTVEQATTEIERAMNRIKAARLK